MNINNDHQKWTFLMNIKNERYQWNATYMVLYKPVLRPCHLSMGNIFSVPPLVFFLGFFLLLRIPIACEYQPNDTEGVISQRQRPYP